MTARSDPRLPSALRFLVPSVRDIIFMFLFASILAGPLSTRPLADADIGWHIRNGERILETYAVPHTDPFSVSMPTSPWFAWEWLYDVVLGALHRLGGLNAVVWLCALLTALTMTLLLWMLLENRTGLPLAIVLTLLALGAATIHLFARPHIVSWLLSLLWFAGLDRWERGSSAGNPNFRDWIPWLFPLSMLFWVNMHGGWIFGLALLIVFTMASWMESRRTPDPLVAIAASLRARVMALALYRSALVTLLNPYSWRLHSHIYRYLGDRYLMNRIDEFRSPDFHGWSERCFALLVILLLVGLAVRRHTIRPSHLLTALLAVYSGFYASRNLAVSAMLLAMIVGPLLWDAWISLATRSEGWNLVCDTASRSASFAARMEGQEIQLHGHIWPIALVITGAVLCLEGGWLGERHLIHASFDDQKLPAAAVAFLGQHSDSGPVFSTDSWGGYLIYHWYPARRVLIDDRHDFYGSPWIRDYLIMMQCEPGWREVLEKWQVRTVLLPAEAPLSNLLREASAQWRVIYEDKVAVVFEKKSKGDAVP